jgi:hypothetical protein
LYHLTVLAHYDKIPLNTVIFSNDILFTEQTVSATPTSRTVYYVGVLINLWLFLFAAQPKEFFLYGLKKLDQRTQKCVELRGEHVE